MIWTFRRNFFCKQCQQHREFRVHSVEDKEEHVEVEFVHRIGDISIFHHFETIGMEKELWLLYMEEYAKGKK